MAKTLARCMIWRTTCAFLSKFTSSCPSIPATGSTGIPRSRRTQSSAQLSRYYRMRFAFSTTSRLQIILPMLRTRRSMLQPLWVQTRINKYCTVMATTSIFSKGMRLGRIQCRSSRSKIASWLAVLWARVRRPSSQLTAVKPWAGCLPLSSFSLPSKASANWRRVW